MNRTVEHVITGLDIGGAELMLSNLAKRGVGYRHAITSLNANGLIAADLRAHGIEVTELGIGRGVRVFGSVRRIARKLVAGRPVITQTWLYHADLIGGLAARRAGVPVVWNLRQTEVHPGGHKITTAMVVRLCAILSRSLPQRIVCGSRAAKESHYNMGFDKTKMAVISNGVDTDLFKHDCIARNEIRSELGVSFDARLIGRIGRYHPQKDYKTFAKMAARLVESLPNSCFVMAGTGVDWSNKELVGWLDDLKITRNCRLLGSRQDVARIMSGLDLLVSSSAYGEGFPNVVAEAMACEVPCVATNVGDSLEIIGDPECVTERADDRALATAAMNTLTRSLDIRKNLGKNARQRIRERYSLDHMVARYEHLYDEIAENVSGGTVDKATRKNVY